MVSINNLSDRYDIVNNSSVVCINMTTISINPIQLIFMLFDCDHGVILAGTIMNGLWGEGGWQLKETVAPTSSSCLFLRKFQCDLQHLQHSNFQKSGHYRFVIRYSILRINSCPPENGIISQQSWLISSFAWNRDVARKSVVCIGLGKKRDVMWCYDMIYKLCMYIVYGVFILCMCVPRTFAYAHLRMPNVLQSIWSIWDIIWFR